MKLPELLAPAGEYKTAIGAINAGADAVYLGAPAFSARAYAQNLSIEEIIQVIQYGHLHHAKIYLALNILLKNKELEEAMQTVRPLYEAGLDGIIVQDLGLLRLLRQVYPEMECHSSTQMAILSTAGMKFVQGFGVTRVVPGRELSLEEIQQMKAFPLELECFIHGAMCYSYSGRCLFSSLAGGRSGNRGRCAGPCRKSYEAQNGETGFFLSMKDMCSIRLVPELMDAGVDSFKIEGRMKDPAYASGVVATYRRFIDAYKAGEAPSSAKWKKALQESTDYLKKLYIRGDIQDGYYHKHNGKAMISVQSPAYQGISEEVKQELYNKYVNQVQKRPISVTITVYENCPVTLLLQDDASGCIQEVQGITAEKARTKGLTVEEIKKQISKFGSSFFEAKEVEVYTDENSFVPVAALNQLRREAIAGLMKQLCQEREEARTDLHRAILDFVSSDSKNESREIATAKEFQNVTKIQITNLEQFFAAYELGYRRFIMPFYLPLEDISILKQKDASLTLYIKLPEVVRQNRLSAIRSHLQKVLQTGIVQGVYVSSLDALSLCQELLSKEQIFADSGIPVFNTATEQIILQHCAMYTASSELNEKELKHFHANDKRELVLYGYEQLMVSANCIQKTTMGCNRDVRFCSLKDENQRTFPVQLCHEDCYSLTYNCLPLSLHTPLKAILSQRQAGAYRMNFTIESPDEMKAVLSTYEHIVTGSGEVHVPWNYTTGHWKRGVE